MAYWNPSDKSADITLSSSDTVATLDITSTYLSCRGVTGHATGKYYLEFLVGTVNNGMSLGIAKATFTLTDQLGSGVSGTSAGIIKADGNTYYDSSPGASAVGAYVSSNVIMLAYDADSGKVWSGKNNVWQGDPAAGTGQQHTISTGTYYPAMSASVSGNSVTLRTASGDFSYSIPSGFSAWDSASVDTGLAWIRA